MATSKSINSSARHLKAKNNLDKVLESIDRMPLQEQETVTDMALRILRITTQGNQLAPVAMALASAQMALELSPQ